MPHLARLVVLSAVLLLAAAACDGRQYLFVTLDSDTPLTFASLDVTVENAGRVGTAHYDHGATVPPATTATLHFDEVHAGEAVVTFVARDIGGKELARGSDTVTLTPNRRTDVAIHFGKSSVYVDGGLPDGLNKLGFAPPVKYAVGGTLGRLWVNDTDKDGLADILGIFNNDYLATVRGKAGGGYREPVSVYSGFSLAKIQLSDVNKDGLLDFVSCGKDITAGPALAIIRYARGDGSFGDEATIFRPDSSCINLAVADFGRDQRVDVLVLAADQVRARPLLFRGNAGGKLDDAIESATTDYGVDVALGDINGDGYLDFLQSSPIPQVLVSIARADGTFFDVASSELRHPSLGLALRDLDRDGHLDAVLSDPVTGEISIARGNGDGTFKVATALGTVPSFGFVIGDVDADGLEDILGVQPKQQNLNVFHGNGDGTFASALTVPGTAHMGRYPTVADLDADGDLDIAIADGEGAEGAVAVFLNTLR